MHESSKLFRDCGSIEIENFAGIQELALEVRPFTTLIGPQSVGKSIAAKLLYYFKSLGWELYSSASSLETISPEEHLLARLSSLLPDPTNSHGASSISFKIGNLRIRLSKIASKSSGWKIELPPHLKKSHRELAAALAKAKNDEDSEEENSLSRRWDIEEEASDKFWASFSDDFPSAASQPRFIPAGRSFYAQIERDIASYFESASLDPFVADFGKLLSRLKHRRLKIRGNKPSGEAASELVFALLSGRYERMDADDFILASDGRVLPSKLWSSGQQEVQPLAFILQRYCEGSFRTRTLFIEEPEAHLFPASQKVAMELVALAFNSRPEALSVFITTHSPYILTTLNNLIQAGKLYSEKSQKVRAEVMKVVPEDRAIDPRWVGAYYMDREECRSIIDKETGLIDASAIDSVSAGIAEDFDALLTLL